jgi:putative multiple sugar transport system permease protein
MLILDFSYLLSRHKGLPNVPVIIGVLILIYTFRRTTIGRRIYALGGNRLAAQLSRIRTERLTFLTSSIWACLPVSSLPPV